jgi:serine/threonine protein kinase
MKKIDIDKILNEQKIDRKYFENETCILQNLKSPYVCKCYNIFQEGKFLFFLMEFMNNSDLNTFYEANKALGKQIPEEQLWNIFYKCISGLKYIHEKGLIHRDIKLENLFLDDDFNIKIGDFNVSATVDQRSAENFADDQEELDNLVSGMTVVGTRGYMAPEVKRNERMTSSYGTKADVYSMGVSFFELCYGCKPYENSKKEDFYNKNLYSKELNYIVDKMIERNDRKRPYSEEAYTYIRKFFIKKCVKNSSLDAALHCFYCYENFKSFFNDNKNKYFISQLNDNENQENNDEQINHKFEIGNSVFNAMQ